MKEHYKCWWCEYQVIQSGKENHPQFNKWYTKKQLIKEHLESRHIDYVCPECGRVVICRRD